MNLKASVEKTMDFLATNKIGRTTLTLEEVDYWLINYSDTLFCYGELREVIFTPVTPNTYKVYTRKVK